MKFNKILGRPGFYETKPSRRLLGKYCSENLGLEWFKSFYIYTLYVNVKDLRLLSGFNHLKVT